jgi:hypothetical protein
MVTVELLLNDWPVILCAVLAAAALAASWIAAMKLRAVRAQGLVLESRVAALRRDLDRVGAVAAQGCARALNLEQAQVRSLARLQRIEQGYTKICDRIELAEFRGEGRSFDQAIEFARRGADPGKLAEKFGLSRGEAELVTRLHGRAARA